jgi:trimeric autotransporter adhesin
MQSNSRTNVTSAAVLLAAVLFPLFAQQPDEPATTVPRLVQVTGTFHAANGLPAGTTESATLSIYKDEQGGTPLWQETQNVSVDAEGHYTAMLGATLKDGVPVDLFSTNEPRWLGVQFNRAGETEQSRVQLVSVPYALKASDAETLGGKPASAYLLDPNAAGSANTTNSSNSSGSATIASLPNSKSLKPDAITGNMNYIPYFTDNSNDLGNSILYQKGSDVGINTANPQYRLDVADRIVNVSGLVPGYTLTDTQASGHQWALFSGDPAAGYFKIRDNTAAADRVVINTAGDVGIGTTTPGSLLDVAGNINFSGELSYQGSPILHVPSGGDYYNIAVGLSALDSNTTGSDNTATGAFALFDNTTGTDNTAAGMFALRNNTSGGVNTASGYYALVNNTTGSRNTATGYGALMENTTGSNNSWSGP